LIGQSVNSAALPESRVSPRHSQWKRKVEAMPEAFICDAVRTPIGRYAGALAAVRADDLAAHPLRVLKERNSGIDWEAVDDIIMGCANQAGEDNRNVARMAALIVASGEAVKKYGLAPRARFVAGAVVGVPPRIMGMGPAPASKRVLAKAGLALADIDVIEINEAFASQSLAALRELGLADDADHVNSNGGAIALGHPLGMSGARLVLTAIEEIQRRKARYALCAMCIGVGQGIASVVERV
jgi:acetyl-CoA acetyltransferase